MNEKLAEANEMIDEQETLKKKIEIELEVGSTHVNRGINPYQKWIHLARAVDAWRIFPRMFLSVYIFLLYYRFLILFENRFCISFDKSGTSYSR